MEYVEEEITVSEFAERFLNINDFTTPAIYDTNDLEIEVLSKNLKTNVDEYKKIKSFLVKEEVDNYFTDGNLNGTGNHRIIENNIDINLKDHPDFKNILKNMKVVDIEVEDNSNYYANGRLNHNTTSGGMAVAFHSSVRIRLSNAGALKKKDWGGVEQIIGNKIDAKIIKNRIGPPQRKASFEIFYDSGIDNYSGWIKVLTTYKFLKQGGAYYTYTLDGEDIKFQSKELPLLLQQNKKLYDSMYKNLCDASITSYKKNGIICMDDDVELDTNDQGGAE